MKFLSILLFLLSLTTLLKSQDTLFFNRERKPISSAKGAVFKQIVTKSDSGFVVVTMKKDNQIQFKTTFKDKDQKVKHGYSIDYIGSNISSEGRFINNRHEGVWKYYHDNGVVSGVVTYKNDKVVHEEYYKSSGEKETDIIKANKMPEYKEGMSAMFDYIKTAMRYPTQSKKDGVTGTVKVSFVVNKSGEIVDAKVISGVNEELDQEAIRVVNSMPDWNPGTQFNRAVRVKYVLPISFKY